MPATPKPCPICQKAVPMPPEKAFPFCSDRCKVIDLGKWLSGDYSVPVVDDDEATPEGLVDADGKILH